MGKTVKKTAAKKSAKKVKVSVDSKSAGSLVPVKGKSQRPKPKTGLSDEAKADGITLDMSIVDRSKWAIENNDFSVFKDDEISHRHAAINQRYALDKEELRKEGEALQRSMGLIE